MSETGEQLLTEVTIYVAGRPKPKGSMKYIGKGQMVEQVAGSKQWRERVRNAMEIAITRQSGTRPWVVGKTDHFEVTIDAFFVPPKGGIYRTVPSGRGKGDIDKIARNILDAMTDSGAIVDDSQITRLVAEKRYGPEEGAIITLAFRAPPKGLVPLRERNITDELREQRGQHMKRYWEEVRAGIRTRPVPQRRGEPADVVH